MPPAASPATGSVRVRVPAKINLALMVGSAAADGYHPLATVFQAVSLFDDVVVTPAEPGECRVSVTGGSEAVAGGEDNLAVRAARLLAREHGTPGLPGVEIAIRKRIPVAGGMAGGSADAAASLLACSVLWDLDVAPDELARLGAALGADVPFALLGGTALGTGRGDVLAPVLGRGWLHWVVVTATEGLSTPTVFRRLDERGEGRDPAGLEIPDAMMEALRTGDARALAPLLHNDLTAAALDLRPDLARTLSAGLERGALAALLSGSGPTCVFLCAGEAAAVDLSTALAQGAGVASVIRVRGPVQGAHLVG